MKKKDLRNLSNEEICEFLLNNHQADALELNALSRITAETTKDGYKNKVIYYDNDMEIVYSYLIAGGCLFQNFYIYSRWWGKIKNSYFTLEGDYGKFEEKKYGLINFDDLEPYKCQNKVNINNKNQSARIDVVDFSSLVAYYQRVFKVSPSYEVVNVYEDAPPDDRVEIEITIPDEGIFFATGSSKKAAANKFAKKHFV